MLINNQSNTLYANCKFPILSVNQIEIRFRLLFDMLFINEINGRRPLTTQTIKIVFYRLFSKSIASQTITQVAIFIWAIVLKY